MAHRVPIIAVLGQTGAGKSKLALEIAQKYCGEIISTDSMQASLLSDNWVFLVKYEGESWFKNRSMLKHAIKSYVCSTQFQK